MLNKEEQTGLVATLFRMDFKERQFRMVTNDLLLIASSVNCHHILVNQF